MGNEISAELREEYNVYLQKANVLLVGMSAPLARLRDVSTNGNLVEKNAIILRTVAHMVLFLYDPTTLSPRSIPTAP